MRAIKGCALCFLHVSPRTPSIPKPPHRYVKENVVAQFPVFKAVAQARMKTGTCSTLPAEGLEAQDLEGKGFPASKG